MRAVAPRVLPFVCCLRGNVVVIKNRACGVTMCISYRAKLPRGISMSCRMTVWVGDDGISRIVGERRYVAHWVFGRRQAVVVAGTVVVIVGEK